MSSKKTSKKSVSKNNSDKLTQKRKDKKMQKNKITFLCVLGVMVLLFALIKTNQLLLTKNSDVIIFVNSTAGTDISEETAKEDGMYFYDFSSNSVFEYSFDGYDFNSIKCVAAKSLTNVCCCAEQDGEYKLLLLNLSEVKASISLPSAADNIRFIDGRYFFSADFGSGNTVYAADFEKGTYSPAESVSFDEKKTKLFGKDCTVLCENPDENYAILRADSTSDGYADIYIKDTRTQVYKKLNKMSFYYPVFASSVS